MGNCCVAPSGSSSEKKKEKRNKPNPFAIDYGATKASGSGNKSTVLKDPTGNDISLGYNLGRELGRGEFGITYLAIDVETGEKYACKSISKKKLRTAVDIEDVRREVEIMKHLPKHPNVVSLKDTYEDDNAVHIVMELCEGGELFDRIVARGHYTERAAAAVMRTIVEVVQACHRQGVIHRDLKPENFLFANKKETAALKAIDFGLSIFFKPGEHFTEIVGSPYYMAPEVLKRNYGPEIDVWSAGVILYILLCGVPPFWAETEQGVAQAIIRSVIDFKRDPWPKVSDNAKDLVKRMLDPDPNKRLTAQEVLEHPWIQNAKKAPNVPLGETVKARLKQFSVMNKLKKRALKVIAEHLSVEEVAGIKEAFDKMDTNKRGKINLEELRVGLQKIGQQIPEADLQILMQAVCIELLLYRFLYILFFHFLAFWKILFWDFKVVHLARAILFATGMLLVMVFDMYLYEVPALQNVQEALKIYLSLFLQCTAAAKYCNLVHQTSWKLVLLLSIYPNFDWLEKQQNSEVVSAYLRVFLRWDPVIGKRSSCHALF